MRQLPILIGDILVSSEILLEYFCCDYESCRGACCIEGEGGAPLLRKECALLRRNYHKYREFMSKDGRTEVESDGFFRIGADGDYETPLLGHGEECAYTCSKGRIACVPSSGPIRWANVLLSNPYPAGFTPYALPGCPMD